MFKLKRTKKRRPDRWRIGENENWFSHMSEQGLHLDEIKPDWAYFNRGEPEQYNYRIDFGEFSAQRLELYHDSGWDFVCSDSLTGVFRSPKSRNATELHTDPIEMSLALKKLKNSYLYYCLYSIVGLIILCTMMYFVVFRRYSMLLYIVEFNNAGGTVGIVVMIFLVFLTVKDAFAVRKLVLSLREGKPLDHNADWRLPLRRKKTIAAAITMVQLLIIFFTLFALEFYTKENLPQDKGTDLFISSNHSVIRLADIESDARLTRKAYPPSAKGYDYYSNIEYRWSPFLSIYLQVSETGEVPDRQWANSSYIRTVSDKDTAYEPHIFYTIYQSRFSFLTEPLFAGLLKRIEYYGSITDSLVAENLEHGEFEKLYILDRTVLSDITSVPQIRVLAKTQFYIIDLTYRGEENPDTVLLAIKERLLD